MERDVIAIKTLGANCIRFADHPPHPYMLNLCDRYGLFALVELPISSPAEVLADEGYRETAAGLAREMVQRDRSHVSVLGWGIGNEFEVTGAGPQTFVRQIVQQIRSLDARPTYYGGLLLPADSCAPLVDLAAVNLYAESGKEFKAQLERWRSWHKDRPLIISRFGAEVEEQNKNGYSDPLSQQNQARFYLQRLEAVRSLDYDGAFVWSFNDWQGDRPALTVHSADPTLCSMGLVSAAREKRIAYDAVRSVFEAEKFSALPQGTYSAGAPIVYVLSGFILLVFLAYLYNANRRFRESMNRSLLNSYNFFADVRDQHSVPLLHSAYLGLIVSFAVMVVASSFLLHFRDNRFLDDLLSLILVRDDLKALLVLLVRDPLRFILIGGTTFFFCLVCVGVLLLGLRVILKTRLRFYHLFTVVIWSLSPLIVLIPVGMILFRVMESAIYVVPALLLCGVLLIWVFLRVLKGISIVFDVRRVRVFVLGLTGLLCVLGALYAYYDLALGARGYFLFLLQTLAIGS